MPDVEQLKYLQSLPLEEKIQKSMARIIEWYENWGGQVYVSFSGGKDSTVLLDLVRRIYPDVPAVYSDTGLEYPELRTFVKEQNNVEIIKPEKSFREIVKNYGYPLISKEVAEAIYYARRLGGGQDSNSQTSRTPRKTNGLETYAKRAELLGQRTATTRQLLREKLGGQRDNEKTQRFDGTLAKYTQFGGNGKTGHWKRLELTGNVPLVQRRDYFAGKEEPIGRCL